MKSRPVDRGGKRCRLVNYYETSMIKSRNGQCPFCIKSYLQFNQVFTASAHETSSFDYEADENLNPSKTRPLTDGQGLDRIEILFRDKVVPC